MGVLSDIIKEYYERRGLVWPDFDNAMKFVATEIGEVYEIDLDRNTWVRNNPEDKPKFSKEDLAKELGDVLMMVMVAGIAEGVDPLDALLDKMYKKTGVWNGITRFSNVVFYPYAEVGSAGHTYYIKPDVQVTPTKNGNTWD